MVVSSVCQAPCAPRPPTLVDLVMASFDRLKSDADAEQIVQFFDEPIPKRELCYRLLDHAAHHRSQALVYLRLKGIVPPEYPG